MIQIIAIGLLALGVVTFVGGVLHKYNSAVEKAQQAEVKLKDCGTKYESALRSITVQNEGLAALTNERNKAQELAAQAMKLAQEQAKRNEPERQRLAALEQTFKSSGPCPAGDAVKEFRKGLKP